MRRVARLACAAVVLATGPLVTACDSLDTFELFDTKKKIVGERKPVFPDGVPGASAGIPAELVKGYREPEHAEVTDPARVAAEAAAAEAAKPKPRTAMPAPARAAAKPPVQRTVTKPPPKPPSTTAQSSATAPPTTAAPPANSVATAPPASGQPGAATPPWPSAPQPQAAWPGTAGTVAR
jgi:hypothetical protein